MGNADSIATGGANGAVGPILMRKVAPLTVQAQDISVPELDVYKDSIFASVADRLRNVSFQMDTSARSPKFATQMQAIASQLSQVVAHNRL